SAHLRGARHGSRARGPRQPGARPGQRAVQPGAALARGHRSVAVVGSPNRRSRAGLLFAAFTVASLLMLLASRTDPAQTLQQASARALEPVRGAVAGAGEAVVGVFGTIGEIDRLRSENDQLRSQLVG